MHARHVSLFQRTSSRPSTRPARSPPRNTQCHRLRARRSDGCQLRWWGTHCFGNLLELITKLQGIRVTVWAENLHLAGGPEFKHIAFWTIEYWFYFKRVNGMTPKMTEFSQSNCNYQKIVNQIFIAICIQRLAALQCWTWAFQILKHIYCIYLSRLSCATIKPKETWTCIFWSCNGHSKSNFISRTYSNANFVCSPPQIPSNRSDKRFNFYRFSSDITIHKEIALRASNASNETKAEIK